MTKCEGMNCNATTGPHSPECIAQHAAAVANGRFVPHSQPPSVGGEPEVMAFLHSSDGYMNERWVDLRRDNTCNPRELILRDHHRYAVTARDQQIAALQAGKTSLEEELGFLSEDLNHAKRNCSAFEERMGDFQVENGKLREQIAELQARVAELEKDAARYQFLRDGDRGGLEYWDGELVVCDVEDTVSGKALDGAVDNAIESMKERLAQQVTNHGE